jgi:hypothetical protein
VKLSSLPGVMIKDVAAALFRVARRVIRWRKIMSRIEEALLRRFSGLKIMVWSIALGVAGVAPLLLYGAFGPADGNPIGLGLLAVAAVPFAGAGVVVGLIKMLVEHFAGRGN